MSRGLHRLRSLLGKGFLAVVALLVVSWYFKGRLPAPSAVEPSALREPVQRPTARSSFSFRHKGKACRVRPVAEYELSGLVVSHNRIESVADIYHDSTSVDTKDLCVVWGENLRGDVYRQVEYSSGPWTCYVSYPEGLAFSDEAVANNHLITDDQDLRDRIAQIDVGDQVYLRGLLVDYQLDDWGSFWRETSTVRDDSGCEVVFVEEVRILRPGSPGWHLAYRSGWVLLAVIPVLYLVLLWIESGQDPQRRFGLR